jgi:hypothetical protein
MGPHLIIWGFTSSDEALTPVFQTHYLGTTGYPGEGGGLFEMIRFLESVLDNQMEIVALVENLALDVGVDGLETADLLVLLGHEFLVHSRDLDEQGIVGKIEVGCEPLGWLTF